MHVAHLSLTDFRSYAAAEVDLDPGVTAFVGPNGHGKTNLVEALGYLATLGSHRVAGDVPLIRIGAPRAIVRASVVRDGRPALVELEITAGRANRARVNRAPVPRAREIVGLLRTVLFAPEDLALVKGDPAERRRFLDELLVLRTPRLAGVRQDYDRVLKQRSALLKSAGPRVRAGGADIGTLDVWDSHLAAAGGELVAARLDLVEALRPLVAQAYETIATSALADSAATGLNYRFSLAAGLSGSAAGDADSAVATDLSAFGRNRAALTEALLAAIGRVRRSELERGLCLVGPHRDDLVLQLGQAPAKGYASHGESWSFALALRLAAYELLRGDGQTGGEPVLILDDVFAELDAQRRDRLAKLVSGAEQVLVTAAVPDDVPAELLASRFDVLAGQVRRVGA